MRRLGRWVGRQDRIKGPSGIFGFDIFILTF